MIIFITKEWRHVLYFYCQNNFHFITNMHFIKMLREKRAKFGEYHQGKSDRTVKINSVVLDLKTKHLTWWCLNVIETPLAFVCVATPVFRQTLGWYFSAGQPDAQFAKTLYLILVRLCVAFPAVAKKSGRLSGLIIAWRSRSPVSLNSLSYLLFMISMHAHTNFYFLKNKRSHWKSIKSIISRAAWHVVICCHLVSQKEITVWPFHATYIV